MMGYFDHIASGGRPHPPSPPKGWRGVFGKALSTLQGGEGWVRWVAAGDCSVGAAA